MELQATREIGDLLPPSYCPAASLDIIKWNAILILLFIHPCAIDSKTSWLVQQTPLQWHKHSELLPISQSFPSGTSS